MMKWEGCGKEAAVAYFKVLSIYLTVGTEENHKKPLVRIDGLRTNI
jgi:hypothetical protein